MISYLGTPVIETDRILLRRLEFNDLHSVYDNWISDERVAANRISPPHKETSKTVDRITKILEQYRSKEFCY